MHPFIHSCIHSFIPSFLHAFVHLLSLHAFHCIPLQSIPFHVIHVIHFVFLSFFPSVFLSFFLSCCFLSFCLSVFHSLFLSFIHSFIHHSFMLSFFHSFISFHFISVHVIHSFMYAFDLFIHVFIHSFIQSINSIQFYQFICSFIHSLIPSFIHSFIHVHPFRSISLHFISFIHLHIFWRSWQPPSVGMTEGKSLKARTWLLPKQSSCWNMSRKHPNTLSDMCLQKHEHVQKPTKKLFVGCPNQKHSWDELFKQMVWWSRFRLVLRLLDATALKQIIPDRFNAVHSVVLYFFTETHSPLRKFHLQHITRVWIPRHSSPWQGLDEYTSFFPTDFNILQCYRVWRHISCTSHH